MLDQFHADAVNHRQDHDRNKNLFEIAHETDCLAYFSMRMQIADNRGFPNDKVGENSQVE